MFRPRLDLCLDLCLDSGLGLGQPYPNVKMGWMGQESTQVVMLQGFASRRGATRLKMRQKYRYKKRRASFDARPA